MPARVSRRASHDGEARTLHAFEDRGGESWAQVEVVNSDRNRGGATFGPWGQGRRLGNGEGQPEAGGGVPGDAGHTHGVGAVAFDGEVVDDVRFDADGRTQGRTDGQTRIQDQDPGGVFPEPELAGRAQHPVRNDALHLAPGDLEVAWEHRPDHGEGDGVPDGEIPRPADDLHRLAGTGIDGHAANLVGAGNGIDRQDASDHNAFEPFTDTPDGFDHHAEVVEHIAQFLRVDVEGGEVA